MKKQIRFIIVWASAMYVLTTFIFPLIGISDNQINWPNILFGVPLWTAAGIALYYIEKRKFKKLQAKRNEKLD